jgi:hypothetical protein
VSYWRELPGLAREAYALGWALSGGPMTERVMLGSAVAVALACEHHTDVDILETTLRLGSLEGTWAAIYDRRERLYTKHITAVMAAYRELVAQLPLDDAIERLQRALPPAEAIPADKRPEVATSAGTQAAWLLHQAVDDPSSPEYLATRDAIATGLLDAQAEGQAGAIAIMAQQTGHATIDFDLAFTDAHSALAKLGDHWADAGGWVGRVVQGNATDLGMAWARAAMDGADFEELRIAAKDILDGTDIRAVDTLIDLALGQSFSIGAATLYAREGVGSVDFVTAGGARVCPLCLAAEDKNPYALVEVPHPPLHPYCRCNITPTAASIVSLGANLAKYLVGDAA